MSRVFTDDDLLTWETFLSSGRFGLPDQPKLIFNCLSEQDRRARYVRFNGDQADAEEVLAELPDDRLRAMLAGSQELD